jgi:hypothetical protein
MQVEAALGAYHNPQLLLVTSAKLTLRLVAFQGNVRHRFNEIGNRNIVKVEPKMGMGPLVRPREISCKWHGGAEARCI